MPTVREKRLARGLWWDEALTLVHGCSPVSEACMHCWAAQASHMRAHNPHPAVAARNAGLTEIGPDGPRFNGTVRVDRQALDKPDERRRPTVYAVWNDLYHPEVPAGFIKHAYAVMRATPRHTYIVCTKRPEDIPAALYERDEWNGRPLLRPGEALPNVWHLTTVEHQETADRVEDLLRLRAHGPWPVLGVSCEPLLGPLDLAPWLTHGDIYCPACGRFFDEAADNLCPECGASTHDAKECDDGEDDYRCAKCGYTFNGDEEVMECPYCGYSGGGRCAEPDYVCTHEKTIAHNGDGTLDWAIVGGESGPRARPMHLNWARGIRDHCVAAGVPFFFKQQGEFVLSDDDVPSAAAETFASERRRTRIRYRVAGGDLMARVGRKAAGRLLDGRTWDEMPGTLTRNGE